MYQRQATFSDFQSFQHQCTAVSHHSLRITSRVSMQLKAIKYHTMSSNVTKYDAITSDSIKYRAIRKALVL